MQETRARLPQPWPTIAAALIAAALTQGAGNAQSNVLRQDCRADLKAHCPGHKPGGKEALACLQKNEARLTAACRKAVRASLSHRPAAAQPPPAAASPPTAPPPPVAPKVMSTPAPATIVSMPPPPAQLPGPLPPQRPKAADVTPPKIVAPQAPTVSSPPPAHHAKAPTVRGTAQLRACKRDLARLCPGIRSGSTRKLTCLAAHRRALEPRCRAALTQTEQRH